MTDTELISLNKQQHQIIADSTRYINEAGETDDVKDESESIIPQQKYTNMRRSTSVHINTETNKLIESYNDIKKFECSKIDFKILNKDTSCCYIAMSEKMPYRLLGVI